MVLHNIGYSEPVISFISMLMHVHVCTLYLLLLFRSEFGGRPPSARGTRPPSGTGMRPVSGARGRMPPSCILKFKPQRTVHDLSMSYLKCVAYHGYT